MMQTIKRIPEVKRESLFNKLPEGYKKFYKEFQKTKPLPVHYVHQEGDWKRNPKTGFVSRLSSHPIPLKFPKEMNEGLWGGEGIIQGLIKRSRFSSRVTKYWVPSLSRSVVYTEVLDKYLSVMVTKRLIDLIIQHKGFDNYLLESNACDIRSQLGFNIKRSILMALHDKTLYPDDETTREEVYNKYKHHLEKYDREFSEYYGYSLKDALKKYDLSTEKIKIEPLKIQFRAQLIEKLKEEKLISQETEAEGGWISKINPFG